MPAPLAFTPIIDGPTGALAWGEILATVAAEPPNIAVVSLQDVVAGMPYAASLVIEGTPPLTVNAIGLPAGLSVSGAAIVGTVSLAVAREREAYSVIISAIGPGGWDQVTLPLMVTFAPEFVTTTLPSVQEGAQFAIPIVVRGGRLQPLVLSGADIDGLSITGSSLTGVRSSAGSVALTITAINPVAETAQALSLSVMDQPPDPPPSSGWVRVPRGSEVWIREPRQ